MQVPRASAPTSPLFLRLQFASTPPERPPFLAFSPFRPSPTPGTRRLPGRHSGADNLPIWTPTAMARSQEFARLFQQPASPAQRHSEICRAYFHEFASADHIAKQFHLRVGSVRAIVRDFARDPDLNAFFAAAGPGRKTSPKRDAINERACELRHQGATLGDIRTTLQREGFDLRVCPIRGTEGV